jgi:hypothetical protein
MKDLYRPRLLHGLGLNCTLMKKLEQFQIDTLCQLMDLPIQTSYHGTLVPLQEEGGQD